MPTTDACTSIKLKELRLTVERCRMCPFVPCKLCCYLVAQKSPPSAREFGQTMKMNALCSAVLAVGRQPFMYRCSAAYHDKSGA